MNITTAGISLTHEMYWCKKAISMFKFFLGLKVFKLVLFLFFFVSDYDNEYKTKRNKNQTSLKHFKPRKILIHNIHKDLRQQQYTSNQCIILLWQVEALSIRLKMFKCLSTKRPLVPCLNVSLTSKQCYIECNLYILKIIF